MPATRSLCFLAAALACSPFASAAGIDNVVDLSAVSHDPALDRAPIVPMNGQAFAVEFLVATGDITGARVAFDENGDGLDIAWSTANLIETIGPRERWSAPVPATAATRLTYAIEITDGPDSDYLTTTGTSDDLPASGWWPIDTTTLEHAPLGATPVTGGTVFRVWAPGASSAAVRGSFNNWSATAHPMTRLGQDFIRFVPNATVGGRYKYYFNNSLWKPDPRARAILNNDSYNAVITDPRAFAWANPTFSPRPAEEWVVYQLHVGSFAGRNDPAGSTPAQSRYRDVTARVAHLVELGVNAVMLNPCNEFPGAQSGGYNPLSAFALESTYGTPDEFKAMVDALHGAGIAVILDTVWNHFSSSDNFLWSYDGTQHYFDSPAVNTPWGAQADIDRPQVTQYFLDAQRALLGEFKLDGFRHDAIYELVSAAQAAAGQNLIRTSMQDAQRRFPDTHIIGEIYNNSAWNTSPAGIDLDGQYHEAYKNAIYDAVLAAASGNPDMNRLANAIDGSGAGVNTDKVFNYFELHDEAWPLSGSGNVRAVKRIDTSFPHDDRFALGRTKLANAVTILSQGVPAILMGTEWAEDAGFETEKIDWSHKTTYRPVFDFYRDLIHLRTQHPALFANSPARVYHVNDTSELIVWERSDTQRRSFVAIANFSNADYNDFRVGLPAAGRWAQILNSEDAAYMGRAVGGEPRLLTVEPFPAHAQSQSALVTIPAHGLLLLQLDPDGFPDECCPGNANGDSIVDFDDIVAILANWLEAGAESTPNNSGDANCDGEVNFDDIVTALGAWLSACP